MNKKEPLVSVIMNCLNGEKYLKEAIDSVYAQTYKNWEIIFWDNCSTDKTAQIAKSYNKKLRYFKGEKTVIIAAARNKALAQTNGEFIAFLDCDDLWLPEKLEKQILLFYNDAKTAIVTSNAICFNQKGNCSLFCRSKPKIGYVFRELLSNYYICLSSAIIRRSVLDDIGEWFDPRFSYVEDGDLFLRITYKWYLDYVDEPLAKYRIHNLNLICTRPDLPPKETEMMIDKFISLYPSFETNYKQELIKIRYYVQYYFALIDWQHRENSLVRKRLRPFLFIYPRALVPFVVSIFPYSCYKIFLRFFNKYIRHITMS